MFWSGLTGPTWRDASASKNTDKQTQHNPNLTSVLLQLWPRFIDTLCWIRWNFWDWSTFKKVFRSNKMFQLLSDAHRPALIKVVHELPKSSTWEKSPSSNKITSHKIQETASITTSSITSLCAWKDNMSYAGCRSIFSTVTHIVKCGYSKKVQQKNAWTDTDNHLNFSWYLGHKLLTGTFLAAIWNLLSKHSFQISQEIPVSGMKANTLLLKV